MSISEQLEKEGKIKKEINRIKKLYRDFNKDKARVLEGLIKEAAFMKVELEELRNDLLITGLTELFVQGEQCFNRERPESKLYTSFIQRYSQVMKQLIEMLPAEEKKEEETNLEKFVQKGKGRK
ncbi:hypothetical protein [Clostridium sp. UBA3887]|uniref:hypothetical protein n=1 Tax=Clostridium sp. UBA3887 TaxID=1946356 RepID=UPI003217BE20